MVTNVAPMLIALLHFFSRARLKGPVGLGGEKPVVVFWITPKSTMPGSGVTVTSTVHAVPTMFCNPES
ncbi:hypothetical protein D3C78_1852330 [compost metagenome]